MAAVPISRRFSKWLLLHYPELWAEGLHKALFWGYGVGTLAAFALGATFGRGAQEMLGCYVLLGGYMLYKLFTDRPEVRLRNRATQVLAWRFFILYLPFFHSLTMALASYAFGKSHFNEGDVPQLLMTHAVAVASLVPPLAWLTVTVQFVGTRIGGTAALLSAGFLVVGFAVGLVAWMLPFAVLGPESINSGYVWGALMSGVLLPTQFLLALFMQSMLRKMLIGPA